MFSRYKIALYKNHTQPKSHFTTLTNNSSSRQTWQWWMGDIWGFSVFIKAYQKDVVKSIQKHKNCLKETTLIQIKSALTLQIQKVEKIHSLQRITKVLLYFVNFWWDLYSAISFYLQILRNCLQTKPSLHHILCFGEKPSRKDESQGPLHFIVNNSNNIVNYKF